MQRLNELNIELKNNADDDKAKILQKFFKTLKGEYAEGDIFLGIKVPVLRKIANSYKDLSEKEIDMLLNSKIHEKRFLALLLLIERYNSSDSKGKEKIFSYYLENTGSINNWDLVDLSAEKIIGDYLYDKPKDLLHKLSKSDDLWEKRISILSTFNYIKKGESKHTIEIAKTLLDDDHDLIHKAVGWMLREVGKRCSQGVLTDFLDKEYRRMPRTMLRYAIERLPEEKRKYYLKK